MTAGIALCSSRSACYRNLNSQLRWANHLLSFAQYNTAFLVFWSFHRNCDAKEIFVFIWQKRHVRCMNHAHSGAIVYSDGKKCFISTAASHKAQRPREEVIIIEDNIIWFNHWKCNNIHGWLHINLSLYSYWCTTLNFHDLCLHRNSTQRPVYMIVVWPSAEPCMTAQVRIAVGQLCCHITGETLMRGKSVWPKGIKGNLPYQLAAGLYSSLQHLLQKEIFGWFQFADTISLSPPSGHNESVEWAGSLTVTFGTISLMEEREEADRQIAKVIES